MLSRLATSETPTLLWFWAPWCSICSEEAPAIERLAAEAGAELSVIGIGGRDDAANGPEFVARHGLRTPTMLFDESMATWETYRIVGQPGAVLLDRDGRERGRWSVPSDLRASRSTPRARCRHRRRSGSPSCVNLSMRVATRLTAGSCEPPLAAVRARRWPGEVLPTDSVGPAGAIPGRRDPVAARVGAVALEGPPGRGAAVAVLDAYGRLPPRGADEPPEPASAGHAPRRAAAGSRRRRASSRPPSAADRTRSRRSAGRRARREEDRRAAGTARRPAPADCDRRSPRRSSGTRPDAPR